MILQIKKSESVSKCKFRYRHIFAPITGGLYGAMMLTLAACSPAPQQDMSVPPNVMEQATLSSHDLDMDFEPNILSFTDLTRVETLGRRDTLGAVMSRLGVSAQETYDILAVAAESELINARRVRPGLQVTATFQPAKLNDEDKNIGELIGVSFRANPTHSVFVARQQSGNYTATQLQPRIQVETRQITGEIDVSLYEAALAAGAGDQQVVDFANIFAYDIDFQRDIRAGDHFEFVYEVQTDERGIEISQGEMLYARLSGRHLDRGFYQHTPADDGIPGYYDESGESAQRFLMKTPINGARLSSHFGRRTHPISGYSRLHKGTDFAAPTGTPIYAAGNGVVERASRYGGYGNYVRLRHANGFKTAYAHLSRYGSGMAAGHRVAQGDIIGYVGSTGRSTGPHLHYEVMQNGNHVNAMALDFPSGRTLEGELLEAFEQRRMAIDALRASEDISDNITGELEVASLPSVNVSEG